MSVPILSSCTSAVKKYPCKYPLCKNSYFVCTTCSPHKNLRFHKFPTAPNILLMWKKICNIPLTVCSSNFHICEIHFSASDYTNSLRTYLKPNAIPLPCLLPISNEASVRDDPHPLIPFPVLPISSKASVRDDPSPFIPFLDQPSKVDEINVRPTCSEPLSDHAYVKPGPPKNAQSSKIDYTDKYSFLTENNGILTKLGLRKSDLNQEMLLMYKAHRNVVSRLSKLKTMLKNERAELISIKNLYSDGRFQFIEENLNSVTKEFINSQLRNADKKPAGRRWTAQDKIFALSIYKRSPKLYRYLHVFFQLPSVRLLKDLLSNISFECGIIEPVFEHLKIQVEKMDQLDRHCSLIFDEMSLSHGFYYETDKQRICGFEDLGTLGRNNNSANHALVFMIRGIRKNYKQVVAYYFTRDTIKTQHLKHLIVYIITQLQTLGLHIVATVCDQGATNRAALRELCSQNDVCPSPYHFVVNAERIYTIFDVPHLLKNTRNAMIECSIEFERNKFAKMTYIRSAFDLDRQTRTYKQLSKLREEYFNFKDSFLKMKVKVAAQQLSHTVAASIETFVSSGNLPAEAIHTAEFVSIIDSLFDSLNGYHYHSQDGKKFKCALSDDSPHLEFWSEILSKLGKWKIVDSSGHSRTQFKFVDGWQITIRSVISLWKDLKEKGLKYLSLRNLNQDPLENLFSQIRQHGAFNTNPTCHQFVAALKTVIVNNFSCPLTRGSNCEEDYCQSLGELSVLLFKNKPQDPDLNHNDRAHTCNEDEDTLNITLNNQATSYVAGYILKKINIPECSTCVANLLSENVSEHHLFIMYKEYDGQKRLMYASDYVIELVEKVHMTLYDFLDKHGHQSYLEDKFKASHAYLLNPFCNEHSCQIQIVDKCVRLTLYKYLSEKKEFKRCSKGHVTKSKRLKIS